MKGGVLPDPDFANAETAPHLELVDAAPRPDDLDRAVGAVDCLDVAGADHGALAGVSTPLYLAPAHSPRAVALEDLAGRLGPSFVQARELLLVDLVEPGGAHQLECPFEVRHADAAL